MIHWNFFQLIDFTIYIIKVYLKRNLKLNMTLHVEMKELLSRHEDLIDLLQNGLLRPIRYDYEPDGMTIFCFKD